MKIFEKTGKMALGSRLRLLTARMADDADKIYEIYKMIFQQSGCLLFIHWLKKVL